MRFEYSKIRYFSIATSIFLIIATIILLIFSKAEIQLAINNFNSVSGDLFFKNITYIGNGVLLFLLLIVSFFISKKYVILVGSSSFIMLAFVQSIKWIVNADRPARFFKEEISNFHLVSGINLHEHFSFPSGHTATGFTLFLLLCFLFNKREMLWQTIFFFLAFLVGISRIYLMQHFLIDVTVGAVVALFSVYLSIFITNKIKK